MAHTAETTSREAKIAELKRLITTGRYETLEKLEDAVDAFLWSDRDREQEVQEENVREISQRHPK